MAVDVEKLIVQLSADIKQYEREMRKAVGVSQKQAKAIENRYRNMSRNLDGIGRSAAQSIIAPLAGIGAALSVREVARYADAWTVAGNKIAASAQIAGTQARSLEDLNKIADDTRSGLAETADLYSKLLRSTAGVAKSELEVARATEIVNKAFKAGGAAASEQVAGILQLSQGLGSGILQGDELRSVRENAPILAQALADFYQVNIAGLKKLGEEGKITSEGVFRAILAAQPKIEAAFATTNATIQDGVTRVNNAFTQYIGQTDESLSASQRLVAGLTALADNFDTVADVTLKVASIFAAGLLGRSIGGMIAKLGLAAGAITKFVAAARAASSITGIATALAGVSAAAGPIGLLLGATAATAMVLYSDASSKAEERTNRLKAEMEELGLYAPQAADAIDEVATSIDDLTEAERVRKIREIREELERLRDGTVLGQLLGRENDTLPVIREEAFRGQKMAGIWGSPFESSDKEALAEVERISAALMQGSMSALELRDRLNALEQLDISAPAKELVDRLRDAAPFTEALIRQQEALGDSPALREANDQLRAYRDELDLLGQKNFAAPVVEQIVAIIDEFEKGERSADDARAAIDDLGESAPGFGPLIANVLNAIGVLDSLRAAAVSAAAAVAAAGGATPGRGDGNAEVARRRADAKAAKASAEFIAEQERLQALTKDQLALEREMASVRTDAAKAGAALTEDQIRAIATGNLAADDARSPRSGGGSKGKSSTEKAVERYDDAILKEIEGMRAEADALNELTLGQDLYGSAVAAARKEAELLQQLQNKGVPITAELAMQVRHLTEQWQQADTALAMAAERHEEFQAQLGDFRSFTEGVFDGLITGALTFEDALAKIGAKLLELTLDKSFERLWDGPGGAGSGGGLSGTVGTFLRAIGFERGGYTGPGGRKTPAGIVHKGEVVWSQSDVRRAGGVGMVEAMRRGMGGYANGGPVMPSVAPQIPMARRSEASSSVAGVLTGEIGVTVDDDGRVQAYVKRAVIQGSRAAEASAVNTVKRNLPAWNRNTKIYGAP
ncbi:tape measure protein [Salipiger marinus]|uniref:Tape measure domain-containing protein n=1 Tax=Salipiger marinus TaxID=555512 RepID=A0A1G8PTS6_9RHOB|nr:tape measure protein [Salipiger marinus]SDI95748.1 tape measure domain-containing protein [Salipiger marinus]